MTKDIVDTGNREVHLELKTGTRVNIIKVNFFQKITQSVSKVLSKPTPTSSPKAPNSSLANSFTPTKPLKRSMRPTYVRLAQHYTPTIHFVGGRHRLAPHREGILQHPCAEKGLLPNSKGTVPAGEFLKNLRPFKVVPYENRSKNVQTDSRYQYQQRPLEEGEKSHFYELSPRFQFKGIGEKEMESINGGGAL